MEYVALIVALVAALGYQAYASDAQSALEQARAAAKAAAARKLAR